MIETTRTLGASGPTVAALGLGCMGMSDFYGAAGSAGGDRCPTPMMTHLESER